MIKVIAQMLSDSRFVEKVRKGMPLAFEIVEQEFPGAMNVGNAREHVIIALLKWYLGDNEVNPLGATVTLADVRVPGGELSLKTVTGNGGVKVKWTPDQKRATEFLQSYVPHEEILLVRIWWGQEREGLFYIPSEVVIDAFEDLGRENFLVIRFGTNNRGIEYTREAMRRIEKDSRTMRIPIPWFRTGVVHSPYKRWLSFWREV